MENYFILFRKFLFLVPVTILNYSFAYSDGFDHCKDILRDGLRDQISTRDTLDYKLARHNQFCNISKEFNLNDENFENFAREYSKKVKTHESSSGGGGSFGYGPLSFGGNYNQSKKGSELSEGEREQLLIENKKKLIDHYNQKCGDESYENSLKSEATLLSLIANDGQIKAWKDCMLNQSGLFVRITKAGTYQPSKKNRSRPVPVNYAFSIHWRSNEGTHIDRLTATYPKDHVSTEFEGIPRNGGFNITPNICDINGVCLMHAGNIVINVTHKSPRVTSLITISGVTNTGIVKSEIIVLPSLVTTEPIEVPAPAPAPTPRPTSTSTPGSAFDPNRCDLLLGGALCGCYKNYCWAFASEFGRPGEPWCYTQELGVPRGGQKWARCERSSDCSWKMSCGNNVTYLGEDNRTNESTLVTHDSPNRCDRFGNGKQCGCYKNYCWAYLKEESKAGDPWCYTQHIGIPTKQGRWASCNEDKDCSWEMTCGGAVTHRGSD